MLVRLALVSALGVTVPRLAERLPDLAPRPEYRVGVDQVTITPPPRWIPSDLVREVFDSGGFPEPLSLLDPDLNATLAEAFQRHPWVAEVRAVRKSFPARVLLDLDYRRPVAMVQVPEGVYPVDLDGTLLPPADFSAEMAREYPLVLGVRTTPRRGLGVDWGDPMVHSAAKLAATLAPKWKSLKLEAIVCPRTLDEPFLLISQGSRILWGHPPEVDDPAEPTTSQKIGRLEKYVADCGAFNLPRGPYEIDIRHFREISRRPLLLKGTARDGDDRR